MLKIIFCICIVYQINLSVQQQDLGTNPYRPLLDKSNNYAGILPQDISLEFKMDKMPSRTYDWSFVATGGRHTCAIKSGIGWTDGVDYTDRLFCFGRNDEGQLDIPVDMVNDAWDTIYAGWTTTCGRTKKTPEALVCWGDKNSPIMLNNISKSPLGKSTVWLSVSLGNAHACAVYATKNQTEKAGGNLVCWGDDKFGRVTQFPIAKQGTFLQACAAESHSCAMDNEGKISCWGLNTLARAKVPDDLKNVIWKELSCSGGHTCAIDVNGWPACWGFGKHGQLDLHKPIYDKKGIPTKLPYQKFVQISTGLVHTCAVGETLYMKCSAVLNTFAVFLKPNEVICTVEGTSNTVSMNALCFGDTSYGQVVPSDGNTYGVPDRPGFYDFKQTQRCFTMQWKQISAGGYHSCGITLKDPFGKNQLICWGLQDDGQITVMYPGAPATLPTGAAEKLTSIKRLPLFQITLTTCCSERGIFLVRLAHGAMVVNDCFWFNRQVESQFVRVI